MTAHDLAVVAAGSAAGLTGIGIVYAARKQISPIYLLDAAAEVILLVASGIAWALGCQASRRGVGEDDDDRRARPQGSGARLH